MKKKKVEAVAEVDWSSMEEGESRSFRLISFLLSGVVGAAEGHAERKFAALVFGVVEGYG